MRDSDELRGRENHFPWDRLPREVKLLVFKQLDRPQLNVCKALSRETLHFLRATDKLTRKRMLSCVEFNGWKSLPSPVEGRERAVTLTIRCSEEGISKRWPVSMEYFLEGIDMESDKLPLELRRLPLLTENCDIELLRFAFMTVSDSLFQWISQTIRSAGCRVHCLSFECTRMGAVTSSAFLQFLVDINARQLTLDLLRGCSEEHFSAEIWQFIVSRKEFLIFGAGISLQQEYFPFTRVDDFILDQLTATKFSIDAPNRISPEGLHSFIMDVTSGIRKVVRCRIETGFSLHPFRQYMKSKKVKISIEGKTISLCKCE
ncbi:hypothetical protein Q1695_014229 [Nippostrongylus brasiliensis]|nr:hypothetical protein Q1695_014229 [Nippostrongylus brasiliensis]